MDEEVYEGCSGSTSNKDGSMLIQHIQHLSNITLVYLKREIKLLLLLVYDAKSKVDFIGLFKLGIHLHDC